VQVGGVPRRRGATNEKRARRVAGRGFNDMAIAGAAASMRLFGDKVLPRL
jgi:hypothetical protein